MMPGIFLESLEDGGEDQSKRPHKINVWGLEHALYTVEVNKYLYVHTMSCGLLHAACAYMHVQCTSLEGGGGRSPPPSPMYKML